MNFIANSNKKIIKNDLINKFNYKNIKNMPELQKLILNFGCKNFNIQKFATTLLALEIFASKKGGVTTAKKANILLKIQKGQPAGCKITLRNKEIYSFLNKILIEILPKIKNFKGFKIKTQNSTFSFQIVGNEIMLQEFEDQYPLFANLPNLDIQISTNSKSEKELIFLIKAIRIPIYQKNNFLNQN